MRASSSEGTNDREARRTAALMLEVLAGLRSAGQASDALGIALARYYVLERRAVQGMIAALGPRPRGRPRSDEERVRHLTCEVERLEGEVARLESLQRLSQRAIGLPVQPAKAPRGARGGRGPSRGRAKPRAGKVLARLRAGEDADPAPPERARAESRPSAAGRRRDG